MPASLRERANLEYNQDGFHALTLDRPVNIFKRVRTDVLRAETLVRQLLADKSKQLSVRTMCLRFLTSMLSLLQCSLLVVKHRRAQRPPGPVDDKIGLFFISDLPLWDRSWNSDCPPFRFQHCHDADIDLSCSGSGLQAKQRKELETSLLFVGSSSYDCSAR